MSVHSGTDDGNGSDANMVVSVEIRNALHGLAMDFSSTHPVKGMALASGCMSVFQAWLLQVAV